MYSCTGRQLAKVLDLFRDRGYGVVWMWSVVTLHIHVLVNILEGRFCCYTAATPSSAATSTSASAAGSTSVARVSTFGPSWAAALSRHSRYMHCSVVVYLFEIRLREDQGVHAEVGAGQRHGL